MSSILEALQKLEEEKARAADSADANLDPETAEDELFGRGRSGGGGAAIELTPVRLLLFAGAFGALVVVIAIGVALVITRTVTPGVSHAEGPQPASSAAAPSVPATPSATEETASADAAPLLMDEPEDDENSIQDEVDNGGDTSAEETMPVGHPSRYDAPTDTRQEVARADGPTPPPRPEPQQESRPEPRPEPIERAEPDYVERQHTEPPRETPRPNERPQPQQHTWDEREWTPPPQPTPPPERTTPSRPADPSSLPVLSRSEQNRLGLPDIRINFVSQASKTQPRPSALINYNKVYVDEIIPDTNARLIGVTLRGIGIEVNGQQFFVTR